MTDLRDVLLSLADTPVGEPEPVAALKRRAERRRRRRAVKRAGGVVACLTLLSGTVVWARSGARDGSQTVAGPGPSDRPGGAVTVAPPTNAPTTAVADPSTCRNSFNASCGPFRWDPEPPAAPIDVRVTVDPAAPRVGEPVRFTVQINRAAGYVKPVAADTGDGATARSDYAFFSCPSVAFPERYGRWDLPVPEPFRMTIPQTHVYRAAGTYTARFAFETDTCNPQHQPLHPGRGEATVRVTVLP